MHIAPTSDKQFCLRLSWRTELLDFKAIAIFDDPKSPIEFRDKSNTSKVELLVITNAIATAPSIPRCVPLSLIFLMIVLISRATARAETPRSPMGLFEKSNNCTDVLLASAQDIFNAAL